MPIEATALTAGEDPRLREATRIVQTLQARDFTAYFAGGCVRDYLLGIAPSDYDVATDATPEQIIQIFGRRNTLLVGAAFGVVCVHSRSGGQRVQIEVATFRTDGDYLDGRRPSNVRYATIAEDAQRRDFTINGMYFDPIACQLHDLVGGEADLRAGIVRAIGNAMDRIAEDKLRMIRAVRFAARFGYAIEPQTEAAIRAAADTLGVVSAERMADELRKICAADRAAWAFERLYDYRLLETVWPELSDLWDVDPTAAQHCFQSITALSHRDLVAAAACMVYRLHTYRGSTVDAWAGEFSRRLKLSNQESRQIAFASASVDRLIDAAKLPWSQIQPIVASPDADYALHVARAIAATDALPADGLELVEQKRSLPREELDPPPLIDGQDLKRLGLSPGPGFRELLTAARDMQLDGKLHDTAQAIDWVREQTGSGR